MNANPDGWDNFRENKLCKAPSVQLKKPDYLFDMEKFPRCPGVDSGWGGGRCEMSFQVSNFKSEFSARDIEDVLVVGGDFAYLVPPPIYFLLNL